MGAQKPPAGAVPLTRLMCNHNSLAPWLPLCFLFCTRFRGAEPPEQPHNQSGQPQIPWVLLCSFLPCTEGDSQETTRPITLQPQHHLSAPLTHAGRRIPISGRPFPASPAAGEAEAGPSRAGISWQQVTATYGPSSWSRRSRQELGGIYGAVLSSPRRGRRENILRAPATHSGRAAIPSGGPADPDGSPPRGASPGRAGAAPRRAGTRRTDV